MLTCSIFLGKHQKIRQCIHSTMINDNALKIADCQTIQIVDNFKIDAISDNCPVHDDCICLGTAIECFQYIHTSINDIYIYIYVCVYVYEQDENNSVCIYDIYWIKWIWCGYLIRTPSGFWLTVSRNYNFVLSPDASIIAKRCGWGFFSFLGDFVAAFGKRRAKCESLYFKDSAHKRSINADNTHYITYFKEVPATY